MKNLKKVKEISKKLVDLDDFKAILNFLGIVAIEGIILNLVVLNFGLPFTWYSWIGWGCSLWIIENRLIKYIRRVRWK